MRQFALTILTYVSFTSFREVLKPKIREQMRTKSAIVSMIAASTSAVNLELGLDGTEIPRYSSASDCLALSDSSVYHYEWNQKACSCFFEFDIPFVDSCGGNEVFNPFHTPFTTDSVCISKAAYDAIFEHDRGADC